MAIMWILDSISNSAQLLLPFLIAFVTPYVILKWLEDRKYPPGPIGLPLLGYLPFLTEEPHKKLWELSKKYGKIMSLYFGRNRVIVITDCKIAKEALAHPAALSKVESSQELIPGNGGFGAMNGEAWTEQRRFVMHTMRNLGLGRGVWENVIQEYAEEFVNEARKWKGEATDYQHHLELSQAGNILALIIGKRLPMDRTHPEAQLLLKTTAAIIEALSPSSINTMAPFLIKYLMRLPISRYYELSKLFREFEKLLNEEIRKHKKNQDTEAQTDFVGYYLQEIEKHQKVEKTHYFNVDSLIGNVLQLFAGGTDTITTSLYWLLLLMASYPEVQKKVQEEIDNTLGRDKRIYWDQRTKFPYTMAAILETERWIAITPLLATRMATESISLCGYTVPKGSLIICNAWAIMRDASYFKEPHRYKPEHFLTEDGKEIKKPEAYLPFSFGKRNCPGETVAMMSIFIYFVSIMQKFTMKIPDGKLANFEAKFSITISPKYPQKLCFIER